MSIDEESGKKPGAKDLFSLVKRSPALMVTAIAGILLVGFILVKRNSSSGAAASPMVPDGTTLAATTTPGGYYSQQSPYVEPVVITNNPPPITLPSTGGTIPSTSIQPTPVGATGSATIPSANYQDDIVRTRYGNPGVTKYDTANPGGVPIRSAPAATATDTIRQAAYGSKIQVTGPAVAGTSNLGGDKGTNFWYPVAGGGYVSAFDVQSSFPAAKTMATVPANH